MTQPPNSPPEQWQERKDRVTRKLIIDMEALQQEVKSLSELVSGFDEQLEGRMRPAVTWQGLAGLLVGLVGLIFLVVGALVTPAKESATAARLEAKESRKELADEVKDFKREVSSKIDKIDARTEGQFKAQFEGRSKDEVREEVQRKVRKANGSDSNSR